MIVSEVKLALTLFVPWFSGVEKPGGTLQEQRTPYNILFVSRNHIQFFGVDFKSIFY